MFLSGSRIQFASHFREDSMRSIVAVVISSVCLVSATNARGHAAQDNHRIAAADPFTGTWKMNRAKSTQKTGEPPIFETVNIRVENGVHHAVVDYQFVGAPKPSRYSYDIKYNDGEWHTQVGPNTDRPNGTSMMVKVDDRTHYRFTRNAAGQSTGVMMRRLSADGKTYVSTIMSPDGEVTLSKMFEKQ
jgi:hypothetical protein